MSPVTPSKALNRARSKVLKTAEDTVDENIVVSRVELQVTVACATDSQENFQNVELDVPCGEDEVTADCVKGNEVTGNWAKRDIDDDEPIIRQEKKKRLST